LEQIKDKVIKQMIINKIKKIMIEIEVDGSYIIDAYELDDLLLGHFEDLGILYENKILDIHMIYEEFDWYIITCWENDDINEYIKYQREKEGWDIYKRFENIYQKSKLHGITKQD
jgi:hypothetical protein